MEYKNVYGWLDYAAKAQGYWPVDLSSVPTSPARLPSSGDPSLDSAFAQLTADANWAQVARQLTSFGVLQGYTGFWLRRDKYDLEIAVAYSWTGVINKRVIKPRVDALWVSTDSLAGRLGQMSFKGTNLDKVVQVATSFAENSWQAKLAKLVVDLNFSTIPTVVFLAVGLGGLSPELTTAVENWSDIEFSRINKFKGVVVNPSLRTGLIDASGQYLRAHGITHSYSLSLPKLNDSFAVYS